ncbi:glucokinase [Paenibacillus sp. DS2015]|uniref:ROK family protein n=1 Tax=Paenibacillus sp. DS2015 TaxID=3373917 RepID=UPI003D20A88C
MKYYVGVDLGGTNIAAGVVDENYQIISRHHVRTYASKTFEELIADIAKAVYDVVDKANLSMSEIVSVGLGTPSCINPETGMLVHANNLNWENVPLPKEMEKHFQVPVFIRNDADCAALGEVLAGAASKYDNALMVTLGTGVGGGIIMDKQIFNGSDHMGAEVGHTKLVYEGIKCTCGQYGCFESYASATALIRRTKETMQQHPESIINDLCENDTDAVDAKMVFDAAQLGDVTALGLIDQYINYVAAGLSTLIVIFRPQVIIVGGGISNQREYLIDPLKKKLIRYTFAAEKIGVPHVIAAELGNDAGIIGAAMIGCQT